VTTDDFVVSADGHLLEPVDLFRTRLPANLRHMAVWEEEFEVDPPFEGGASTFRKLHTPGFEGWTVSRYRQTRGRTPEGDPEIILEDMDSDGVDAQVLHPNLSQFGLFTDHHEMSIAHARVYNDYVLERFAAHFDRLAPTAPIPLTDIDDAVAEIQRVAAGGFRGVLLPATAPMPYYRRELDPVWSAISETAMSVFIHTQTGGIRVEDPEALTLRVMMENAQQVNQPMTEKAAAKRMVTQAVMQPVVPQQVICQLIGGGVPERFPNLHFSLIEFNAYWLSSLVGSMDKCWVTGIGQDADWWIGVWDDERGDHDQPNMAQLFKLNEKWPHPLMPSEYVKRQFHVSFQDDPVAVACRHITGLSTVVWGNDYPHAEGTWGESDKLLDQLMAGVPADERAAMVGGTLADLLGFDTASGHSTATTN
jgi:predicted TIM-barrel fold metal-dependent hydrolase